MATKRLKTYTIEFTLDQFPEFSEFEIRQALEPRYPDTYQDLKTITKEDLKYLQETLAPALPEPKEQLALPKASQETSEVSETAELQETSEMPLEEPTTDGNDSNDESPSKIVTQAKSTSLRKAVQEQKQNLAEYQESRHRETINLEDLAVRDETTARTLEEIKLIEETRQEILDSYYEARKNNAINRAVKARQSIQLSNIKSAVETAEKLGKQKQESEERMEKHLQSLTEITGDLDLMSAFF